MTPDLVARLQAAGYDADAAQGRAVWLERASAEFVRETGAQPAWHWSVPGRIEIFGKHTDYAGGRSLLAAVPRGFAVVGGPRTDDRVRVTDARHGDVALIDILDSGRVWRGWANYVAVTARRLARDFPGARLGMDIAFASDLPRAAGLSSSSALVVGIALALIRRGGLEGRDDWRRVIGSVEDLAWYLGCVENGLPYKSLEGTLGVGTHGGSQDHTAILACRPGVVSHYSFIPVRAHGVAPMPESWRFVVASSGVHADKAGSVRERYNRASLAVRALVAISNATNPAESAVSLAAALDRHADAEGQLREAIRRSDLPGFTHADLSRRLTQFVHETARVPRAATAFADMDFTQLHSLARASQEDAEALLGNQIPETVALVGMAYEEGAFAASAFGAGFGGSVWALVAAADAERFGATWLAKYHREYRHRDGADWFSAIPGPGAVEVTATG